MRHYAALIRNAGRIDNSGRQSTADAAANPVTYGIANAVTTPMV